MNIPDPQHWKSDVYVPPKSNKQENLEKKNFLFASLRSVTKRLGSGSVSQRYGSEGSGSVARLDQDTHGSALFWEAGSGSSSALSQNSEALETQSEP
jgi:hypothetical protein